MSEYRTEHDSMGDVQVPADAYYGAQTQRAVDNFPISGWTLPAALVHALGLVKYSSATANRDLGKLTGSGKNPISDKQVEALLAACREVADGKLDGEFPIDVFQTGSGTSSNMNVNEVISNRAIEISGGDRFEAGKPIHPNDHVNMGQSTNDMFPAAIHVAVARSIQEDLVPALERFAESLSAKATAWDRVIKIGRTHLADATPLRLGQEIGGLARQLALSVERAGRAQAAVLELPAGGTAVGTGINTHPEFGARVAASLAEETGIAFVEAVDHFEANAQRDALVEYHGQLRAIAVTLFNVSNNIRWLGAGPRCGFNEIKIPDLQPGSSIMPGKVNPVMCESMMQVAARVIGNDQVVAFGGATGGQFQLNIMMPVMGQTTLESIEFGRTEPVDGHQPQPADRLRKSRGDREGSLRHRQDDPRVVHRAGNSPRGPAQRGARPDADDRAAGVAGKQQPVAGSRIVDRVSRGSVSEPRDWLPAAIPPASVQP